MTTLESLPSERKTRRLFDGLRTKLNDMLDDSRVVFRRRAEDVESRPGPSGGGSGINVPASAVVGFVMYLIAQTAGGIWWAATVQSRNEYLIDQNIKLWGKIETQDLQINRLESGLDERIRGKVRETMDDWGYLRTPRKGE
jgi:hypothetical protein